MKLDQHPRPISLEYEITDCRAIDGDTIEARIVLGFGTSLIRRIRLRGFYAAEIIGPTAGQGLAARERLATALATGNWTIQGRGSREDRYGRVVALPYRDGVPVNPHDVLGPYQLTEQEHAAGLRLAKAATSGRAK
jgi:endonuclease YncB( thermonuclease family)